MKKLDVFFASLKASWVPRFFTNEGKWKAGIECIASTMNVTLECLLRMNFTDTSFINDATGMKPNAFYNEVLLSITVKQ